MIHPVYRVACKVTTNTVNDEMPPFVVVVVVVIAFFVVVCCCFVEVSRLRAS